MNTMDMQEVELLRDAELVGLCLGGDREAFGRIVERYQSLVCALAYSACGDVARSEDLAQETFITAWRQLATLKEPAKLKYWLCGIVRHLISNSVRAQSRNPLASAVSLDDEIAGGSEWNVPSDKAMSQEEEAILWRVLETLPRAYRDALVLYYRSGDSTAEVADTLELSAEAVRQRLARGRAMLNERVARLVESGLRRSNPAKTFAANVLAALPLASVKTGVAATMAAKSTAAAKTGGILGIAGFAAAALGAATGGILAIRGRIQMARSDRERRFLVRASWGFPVWAVFFLVTIHVVASLSGGVITINNLWDAAEWSLVWVAGFGVWVTYSIWMTRRQVRIQMEEGTFEGSTELRFGKVDPTKKGWRAIVYGGLAAMIFGGPFPLLLLVAGAAGDWLVCSALTVLAVAAWLKCAAAIMHRPERIRTIFVGVWWGMALLTLATFNLRFHSWVNPAVVWPDNPNGFHLPPASLNLLVIVLYSSIGLAWWLERRFGLMRGQRPR